METLLDHVCAYTERHADQAGIARTAIEGLSLIRATAPSGLDYAISRPLVALLLQGAKQVTLGSRLFSFAAGESLLISADVPTVSQIVEASAETPYYSLVLELDSAVIADLVMEMEQDSGGIYSPIQVEPTDAEVSDAALRLMRLLDRPASLQMLQAGLLREMHYWLLAGRHGASIRRLGWPDSHAQRVSRAVAVLRKDFNRPIPVEHLAAIAGMSLSSFHQHFRAVTSLSPLQFQKQLRLIEARRLMMANGMSASSAAFAVGYESVPQFTREYARMFGLPPGRDRDAARHESGDLPNEAYA